MITNPTTLTLDAATLDRKLAKSLRINVLQGATLKASADYALPASWPGTVDISAQVAGLSVGAYDIAAILLDASNNEGPSTLATNGPLAVVMGAPTTVTLG